MPTKQSDLKAGDTVAIDGGFTCMKAGTKTVMEAPDGLYVACKSGHHYLGGQEDHDGNLIGVEKVLIVSP